MIMAVYVASLTYNQTLSQVPALTLYNTDAIHSVSKALCVKQDRRPARATTGTVEPLIYYYGGTKVAKYHCLYTAAP